MIIRSVKDVIGTDRDVQGNGWKSRRIVLARDGLNYSVHETIIDANATFHFDYNSHRETVYCIEGTATLTDVSTGATTELSPGSLYSAGIHERHTIQTKTAVKLLCIFEPALLGSEEAD